MDDVVKGLARGGLAKGIGEIQNLKPVIQVKNLTRTLREAIGWFKSFCPFVLDRSKPVKHFQACNIQVSLLSRVVGGSYRKRVSALHGCTPLTVDHLIEWYLSSHGYIHRRILKKDEIWWPYQGNTSHDVRNQCVGILSEHACHKPVLIVT